MKRWVLWTALLLAACGKKDEEPPPKPLVSVATAKVTAEDVPLVIEAPANVFPLEQANVATRITAPIRELRVRKGDSVSAGQVLAVLDNRDALAQRADATASVEDALATLQKMETATIPGDIERAQGQLATAEAALNQAQKNYDRRKELLAQGAIPNRDFLVSQTELAQAKTTYDVAKNGLNLLQNQSRSSDLRSAHAKLESAQAKLQLANVQLQFTEVRSPFAGTVTDQFMYQGDMAQPSSPILSIMNLSSVSARAQVPEAQAGPLEMAQECSFQAESGGLPEINGQVTVINKAVDPARRSVEVWCEIANDQGVLRGNLYGRVRIITGVARGSMMVPVAAVQRNEGTNTGVAMVVDSQSVAHKRDIQTGLTYKSKVQILKGLKLGETVVTDGGYSLPDNTQVKTGNQ